MHVGCSDGVVVVENQVCLPGAGRDLVEDFRQRHLEHRAGADPVRLGRDRSVDDIEIAAPAGPEGVLEGRA